MTQVQVSTDTISPAQAAKIAGGVWRRGSPEQFGTVQFDSRLLQPKEVFIALSAQRDGHDFVDAARQAGASAAIVAREIDCDLPQLQVADTLAALHALARWKRERFTGQVVMITGSNGKSTTREMLRHILEQYVSADHVIGALGNHNNHIGLPLTLLRLCDKLQYAVLEAGMNHAGEIAEMTLLAKPTLGIITNAGRAHLGSFASIEDIARAKGELIENIASHAPLVLNYDDRYFPMWKRTAGAREVLTFSYDGNQNALCRRLQDRDFFFCFDGSTRPREVVLQVYGAHNQANALAAATAAWRLGVPTDCIYAGLENFAGVPGRQEIIMCRKMVLINDAYNASPESFEVALQTLAARPEQTKILIMGDMLELGEQSQRLHDQIVVDAFTRQINYVLGYGERSARAIAAAGNPCGREFTDKAKLVEHTRTLITDSCVVLVKGSYGMAMHEVSQILSKD